MPRDSCPGTSKSHQKEHTPGAADGSWGHVELGEGAAETEAAEKKGEGAVRGEQEENQSMASGEGQREQRLEQKVLKKPTGKTPDRCMASALTKRQNDHGGAWA